MANIFTTSSICRTMSEMYVCTFCKLLLHFLVKVLISFSVLLSCLHTLSKDDNIGVPCIQLLLWAWHLLVQLVSLHLEFFPVSLLVLCRYLVCLIVCLWGIPGRMVPSGIWYLCPLVGRGMWTLLSVLRFNSKFDVLKNSLSAGLQNSILPSMVLSWSLFFIRSPTLVLQRSGTYQSRVMVPCCHMNSSMASFLVLCSSTVGFIAGSAALWQLLQVGFVVHPLCHSSCLNACVVLCWHPFLSVILYVCSLSCGLCTTVLFCV